MKKFLVICLLTGLTGFGGLSAAEFSGTVRSVSGDVATVAMVGDVMPPVGAKAEVYFKLAGVDEEISVASGRALEIANGEMRIKIENASGSVERGQLVRFTSDGLAAQPSAASTPVKTKGSIVGEWKRKFHGPLMIFRADGTLEFEEREGKSTARYSMDMTRVPHHLDFFDFGDAKYAPPGGRALFIFAFAPDGKLKLEGSDKGDRPAQFTVDASTALRVGAAPAGPTLVGVWQKEIPLDERYRFTPEGTVQTSFQAPPDPARMNEYKYKIDATANPPQINFYFGEVNDDPGFRGIFEITAEDHLKIEGRWTKEESERPKIFDKEAGEFVREAWPGAGDPIDVPNTFNEGQSVIEGLARPGSVPPASTTAYRSEVQQMATHVFTFDETEIGPLRDDAFASGGMRFEKGKGAPAIYAAEGNMLLPWPHKKVLLLGGERATSFTIRLDPPAKLFSLYRIGATNGASTPTWKMTAYDGRGKVLGTAGEQHQVNPAAASFSIEAPGITRVELTTDNRHGAGTWATWSSLPVAGFGFER